MARQNPRDRAPVPTRVTGIGGVFLVLSSLRFVRGLGLLSSTPGITVVVGFPFTASPGGPWGLNLSPPAAMFLAAFSSLSSMVPQCGHHSRRWVLSRVLYPHIEHRFDVLLAGI